MISMETSATYVTSNGAAYDTLLDAQYREMADVVLKLFSATDNAGNNIAQAASVILGKYFVDLDDQSLGGIFTAIKAVREVKP